LKGILPPQLAESSDYAMAGVTFRDIAKVFESLGLQVSTVMAIEAYLTAKIDFLFKKNKDLSSQEKNFM